MYYLAIGCIFWFVCGLVGAAITENRGHGAGLGFFLGALFGPLGILIAAVLAVQPVSQTVNPQLQATNQDRRPCPYCAEMILREAKVCRFCGRDIEPLPAISAIAPLEVRGDFLRCPNCDTKNYKNADHCEKCGIAFLKPIADPRVENASDIQSPKSKPPRLEKPRANRLTRGEWAIVAILVFGIFAVFGTLYYFLLVAPTPSKLFAPPTSSLQSEPTHIAPVVLATHQPKVFPSSTPTRRDLFPETVTICIETAYVYSELGGGNVTSTLKRGEVVHILGSVGSWYHIGDSSKNPKGYVLSAVFCPSP